MKISPFFFRHASVKDKITLSWGKAAAYNLPSAILIGHLSRQNGPFKNCIKKRKRLKGSILIWK